MWDFTVTALFSASRSRRIYVLLLPFERVVRHVRERVGELPRRHRESI